ncbi:hypothetical protein QR680_012421 [Steinernema hermaphroditum]|uniref:RNA helicase n=1 Tax=Steinernema hermaphroditum TaxID=289476 RepID=A0AA39I1Z6_9BILA|nr:hypothetical protein QR680_012421 [Steinernema hermaphroditum]
MERIKLESRDEMPMKHAETSTANADPLLAVSVPSDATAFEGKPFDLTDAVGIRIEGGDGSHAMFRSLEAAELPEMMASNLKEMNVTKATPIQLLLLYLIKHKFEHDVLVQADTGAGKTLAYLVPLVSLIHSMRICSTKPAPFRPFAIIVLPTRETAMRVATEARQLVKNVSAQVAMSFEQMDPRETARDIRNGCDIVIGTPRRLLSHVEGGMRGIDSGIGGIKMDNFCWLVVDDADSYANDQEFKRLMDLLCPHSKRLYVFSTSLSKNESDQFKRYMKSTAPFEVFGCRKTINFEWREVTTTDRRFQLLSDLELIRAAHEEMPKTVVFLDDKVVCDSICSFLNVNDILSLSLSSAANKEKREDVVSSWTSGKYKVLVCTNVAARGLKLRNVRFVINYDFPDVDTFAYRTLNSNRAGYRQHVITYFRQGETELARKTIEVLNRMRKAIPDFLYHNAGMQVPERD